MSRVFTRTTACLCEVLRRARQGGAGISKMAFSLTVGFRLRVRRRRALYEGPNKESFFGVMVYNRFWFHNDLYAVTIGGGFMNNPGRYLALTPPINGATAAAAHRTSRSSRGRTLSVGHAAQLPVHAEGLDHLVDGSDVPAFERSLLVGTGGVTPPGGNNGSPASCVGGPADPTTGNCAAGDWFPIFARAKSSWAPASWSSSEACGSRSW